MSEASRLLLSEASRLLLAFETACGGPDVALLRGDEVLAHAAGPPGSRGAESLLPCIDQVLQAAGVTLADIEAFAISIGPGSFTGLRVGVATLKGLAFGDERPIAAVSTLAAVAQAAVAGAGDVVAVLDAQRGEFYAAGYARADASGALVEARPEQGVYLPEALGKLLPAKAGLVGQGAEACAEAMAPAAPPVLGSELALSVATGRLGQARVTAGDIVTAAELVPTYIRRAEAEVQRTGARFE